MRKFKIGIIGCGNMATAIWEGILDAKLAKGGEIIVSDIDADKLRYAKSKGLCVTHSNREITADYIMFAVKPQTFAEVAETVVIPKESIIISIMAGITIEKIKKYTNAEKIVRVMPNTPCMIKKGVSALTFDNVCDKDKKYIFSLFSSIGDALELSESKFDAVTALSGSGPAYIYVFLEGLIKGGLEGGLTLEESKRLAIATVQGASEMFKQTDTLISELINAVCSKGGTTIEAIKIFDKYKLIDIIAEGIAAARMRSEELSKL